MMFSNLTWGLSGRDTIPTRDINSESSRLQHGLFHHIRILWNLGWLMGTHRQDRARMR